MNLPMMTLPSGAPLIVCTDEELDHETFLKELRAEYPDQQIFYLLAAAEFSDETRLYRMAQTGLGWAIAKVNLERTRLGLGTLKEEAFFQLPALPATLTDSVDQFFRLVDHDLGTEAIVLLTFDPSYGDSADGWGVLVPKQENTSGHCDYDQTSVLDDLPDGVMIVGSIHSHPGMGAFASGTDHHDQTDFEGLHLTFGYPTHKHRQTEVHAELQLAGKTWDIKNEYVMEIVTEIVANDELEEWRKKVTKKVYTGGTSGPLAQRTTGAGTTSRSRQTVGEINRDRPSSCPDIKDNTVIVRVLDGESRCPVCGWTIEGYDAKSRRCGQCYCFWVYGDETRADLIEARKREATYLQSIDLDTSGDHHPWRDIWLWDRWTVAETKAVIGQGRRLWDSKAKHDFEADPQPATDTPPEEVESHPFG